MVGRDGYVCENCGGSTMRPTEKLCGPCRKQKESEQC